MKLVLEFVFGTHTIQAPGQLVIFDLEKIWGGKMFTDQGQLIRVM